MPPNQLLRALTSECTLLAAGLRKQQEDQHHRGCAHLRGRSERRRVGLPLIVWANDQESLTFPARREEQVCLLQAYANSKKISIMGDMPIYVGGQSADVWAYQSLFELGSDGAPLTVSGVPPDAFSETGQLWGSPLYDWQVSYCKEQSLQTCIRLGSDGAPLTVSGVPPDAFSETKQLWGRPLYKWQVRGC